MRKISQQFLSYLRLIRWPNILIIILTQVLLRYAIIAAIYARSGVEPAMSDVLFILLVLTTVIIASAGYIINDYFDVRTDRINRPERIIVGRFIHRRKAIKFHMVLNAIAIVLGFIVSWRVGSFRIGLIFPMIILLLWLYSERYKKIVFAGNLSVAFMSALVALVVWLFEFFALKIQPERFMLVYMDLGLISQIVLSFTVFAFLLSLVREMVKDAEDVYGDSQTGCRTLPVVYGIPVTRRIAASVLGLTLILVIAGSWKLYGLSYIIPALYFVLMVGLPAIYGIYRIAVSDRKEDFHFASNLIKFIMLAGILGMIPMAVYL